MAIRTVLTETLGLEYPAVGGVSHDGQHEAPLHRRPAHGLYGAQGRLDAYLLPALAHGGQVQHRIRVDVAPAARIAVTGHASPVACLEVIGDQLLHAHPERLGGGVAEDLFCGRVPQDYPAGVGVRDDHGVPDALEEAADPQVPRRKTPPSSFGSAMTFTLPAACDLR